jgi:hypothetical protein
VAELRWLHNWLHRKGLARVINGSSSSMNSRVTYRAESPRWLPAAVMRWHLGNHFAWMHPGRAATHQMISLGRSRPTAAGLVRWEAVFDSARPQVIWRHG